MNFNDVVKGYMSKDDVISIMNNSSLNEKTGSL